MAYYFPFNRVLSSDCRLDDRILCAQQSLALFSNPLFEENMHGVAYFFPDCAANL
jgi:hypothetical protein